MSKKKGKPKPKASVPDGSPPFPDMDLSALEFASFGLPSNNPNLFLQTWSQLQSPRIIWFEHLPGFAYGSEHVEGGILAISRPGFVYYRPLDRSLPDSEVGDHMSVPKSRLRFGENAIELYLGPEHIVDRIPFGCRRPSCRAELLSEQDMYGVCECSNDRLIRLSPDMKKLLVSSVTKNSILGVAVYSIRNQFPTVSSPFLRQIYFEPDPAAASCGFSHDSKHLILLPVRWPNYLFFIPLPEGDGIEREQTKHLHEYTEAELVEMLEADTTPPVRKDNHDHPWNGHGPSPGKPGDPSAGGSAPGQGIFDAAIMARLLVQSLGDPDESHGRDEMMRGVLDRDRFVVPEPQGDVRVVGPLNFHTDKGSDPGIALSSLSLEDGEGGDGSDDDEVGMKIIYFHVTTISDVTRPKSWSKPWDAVLTMWNDAHDGSGGLLFYLMTPTGDLEVCWRHFNIAPLHPPVSASTGNRRIHQTAYALELAANPERPNEFSMVIQRTVRHTEGAAGGDASVPNKDSEYRSGMQVFHLECGDPSDASKHIFEKRTFWQLDTNQQGDWTNFVQGRYQPMIGTGHMVFQVDYENVSSGEVSSRIFIGDCCQLMRDVHAPVSRQRVIGENMLVYWPIIYHKADRQYMDDFGPQLFVNIFNDPDLSGPTRHHRYACCHNIACSKLKQVKQTKEVIRVHQTLLLRQLQDVKPDQPDQWMSVSATPADSLTFVPDIPAKTARIGVIRLPECVTCRTLLIEPIVCETCRAVAYCSEACAKEDWSSGHNITCTLSTDIDNDFPGLKYKKKVYMDIQA